LLIKFYLYLKHQIDFVVVCICEWW